MNEKIAVIGLGYVGLPLALAFARKFDDVVGFDINRRRIENLGAGIDKTGEADTQELKKTSLRFSAEQDMLNDRNVFIVTVPTPIDCNRQPDLSALKESSQMIAGFLKKGDFVIYESTVYPGVTEDICGTILAEGSGLVCGRDFFLGYSPERINPGDKHHTLEKITKVVAAQDDAALERMAALYGRVIEAGIFRATSIRVAEAAKVIENTQRDLNIALMNELAIIFDRLNIRTADVLAAAGTKWNFLPFMPGLVGGHCIGVDPYYLTAKAEEVGYHPQVILSGRRINDSMGKIIAEKTVKLLVQAQRPVREARVGILGITFKENVPDLRNSRVPDIGQELAQFGITPLFHDPLVDADEASAEYGIAVSPIEDFKNLDALILAVPHEYYLTKGAKWLAGCIAGCGVLVDVKSCFSAEDMPDRLYWSL